MSLPDKPYRLREARGSDIGFVVQSWRESYREGNELAKCVPRDEYREAMSHVFAKLAGASVVVACDLKDEDVLLGYVVHTGRALHYVYVKEHMRRLGVARDLVANAAPESFTFRTFAFDRRFRTRERAWSYRPTLKYTARVEFGGL